MAAAISRSSRSKERFDYQTFSDNIDCGKCGCLCNHSSFGNLHNHSRPHKDAIMETRCNRKRLGNLSSVHFLTSMTRRLRLLKRP